MKKQLLPLLKNKEKKQGRYSKNVMDKDTKIPNHYSATLSELDIVMALAVPPGGNWKNIPESAPSKRVEQIRTSYKNGGGSRSTYYGRLHPDRPAYTISTNFHRPGNGCHLHYDYKGGQHRVISQREAARLQSFPDNFVFYGSRASVNNQIGNAVPPLLAYQIARTLPFRGRFIDLFAGAGGLSLGFIWAGWKHIVANDIDGSFLETYRKNVDKNTTEGDIRDKRVFEKLVDCVQKERAKDSSTPIIVLGGPPCQGFSTAGNKRSMDDDRNKLFYEYKAMLMAIEPQAFIFENVPGLMSMEQGQVFEMIKSELASTVERLEHWTLQAEQYAIPQRRTRILLVGTSQQDITLERPRPVTRFGPQKLLFDQLPHVIGVRDALSDLPALKSGEDGSDKDYVSAPKNAYQMLMRSELTPDEYLKSLRTEGQAQINSSDHLFLG
jgi:DNA (cytosine-5)-methyltransferase 1